MADEYRVLAGFIKGEIRRQLAATSANDFGRVEDVGEDGRAVVKFRSGTVKVNPNGQAPPIGSFMNTNRGRGLFQDDGFSFYGGGGT